MPLEQSIDRPSPPVSPASSKATSRSGTRRIRTHTSTGYTATSSPSPCSYWARILSVCSAVERSANKRSELHANLKRVAKRDWGDSRQILAPRHQDKVLGRLAAQDPVPGSRRCLHPQIQLRCPDLTHQPLTNRTPHSHNRVIQSCGLAGGDEPARSLGKTRTEARAPRPPPASPDEGCSAEPGCVSATLASTQLTHQPKSTATTTAASSLTHVGFRNRRA